MKGSPAELRWGVVSTAWIAGLVAPSIGTAKGSRLAGIASRDLRRAESFAAAHGVERAYGSYEEILAATEIDAVYLALPNSLHVEWARRALEAGKHVMCEKPLALAAADATALFELASQRGLLLMEAFMYRHHPQIEAVREAVQAGKIGELQAIGSTFHTLVGDPDNIRYDAGLGGGAIWDVGSYCVSLSMLLGGGRPVSCAGAAKRAPSGVDATFAGLLEFESGILASFSCGLEAELRTEAVLVGSEGTLTMANPWLPDVPADIWNGETPRPGFELRRGTAVTEQRVAGSNPYGLQFENFAAAVAAEEAPGIGSAETIENLRTIEALRDGAGL